MRLPALALATASLLSGPALAVVTEAPPTGGAALSAIVTKIESRPDFAFINSIDYGSGKYQVVFYMSDGAEVRMEFDAMTGESVAPKPAAANTQ